MAIGINIDNFPRIIIKFPETFIEEDLDKFFKYILGLMDNENQYIFVLYIDEIKTPPLKYRNKILKFTRELKQKPHYIHYSVIICNSKLTKNFIRLLLNIERPYNVTYIIDKKNHDSDLLSIYNGNPNDSIIKFTTKIKKSAKEN